MGEWCMRVSQKMNTIIPFLEKFMSGKCVTHHAAKSSRYIVQTNTHQILSFLFQ